MDTGPDPDSLIGELIASRYRIEARVGDGAMGKVYRARHVKVGRPFAVKVLRADLLDDATLRRRFVREAELAGSLQHPNVVGVVDIGETSNGLCYLVMEYAPGQTLYDLLVRSAPMPGSRVIAIVRQLCDGLAHAHDRGLIHRDFKPENVIVERDAHGADRLKIIDFGIAILRDEATSSSPERLTTAGMVLGTPHYMAPEQALGSLIDHRVDLFALGVMCFEMLTGRAPFDGDGVDVARANVALDTPAMSERAPGQAVDPLLEAFTRKLMSKSADDRPASAAAARALLDLIDRDPATARAMLGVAPPGPLPSDTWLPMPAAAAPAPVADDPSAAVYRTPAYGVPLAAPARWLTTEELAAAAHLRPRAETTEQTAPAGSRRMMVAALAVAAVAAVLIVAALLAGQRPRAAASSWPMRLGVASEAAAPEATVPSAPQAAAPSAPQAAAPNAPQAAALNAPQAVSPSAPAPLVAAAPSVTAAESATGDAAPVAIAASASRGDGRRPMTIAHGATRAVARTADRPPIGGASAGSPSAGGSSIGGPSTGDASPSAPAAPPLAAAIAAEIPAPRPGAPALPTVPPASADPASVAQLYAAVGKELRALDQRRGAAADLWPAYLRIRINDAIGDTGARDEVYAQLHKLHAQIAKRSVANCDTGPALAAGSTASSPPIGTTAAASSASSPPISSASGTAAQ